MDPVADDLDDAVHARTPPSVPCGDRRAVLPASGSGTAVGPVVDDLEERARRVVSRGTPENTKRAYRSDLRYVGAWCVAMGIDPALPLSVDTMVRFLVDHVDGLAAEVDEDLVRAGVKRELGRHAISTVDRRLSSVSTAHQVSGLPNPCADRRLSKLLSRARVAAALAGWVPGRKAAAPLELLDRMLATCGDAPRDVRDRAMLLFGWSSGGRRRSEIAGADFSRLTRLGDEYVYDLGVTKTDQLGETGTVPVAGRAAAALASWLELSGIEGGPLFRAYDRDGNLGTSALSDKAVARVVKKRAKLAGLDAARFAGHSLRSGFLTETGLQGVSLAEAMGMSKHRNVQVASGYHQAGHGLRNRAARIGG